MTMEILALLLFLTIFLLILYGYPVAFTLAGFRCSTPSVSSIRSLLLLSRPASWG